MRFEDETDEGEEDGMQHIEKQYRGIHLSFPLKRADLDAMIDAFRRKKVNIICIISQCCGL